MYHTLIHCPTSPTRLTSTPTLRIALINSSQLSLAQQIMLCSYGSKVWLEFTNFESLISGKKSNKIVRLYVGDSKGKKLTDVAKKKTIEIFDPELAFVFQKAAIRSWNKNNAKDSASKIAGAIKAGYSEISYHLGFPAASLGYPSEPAIDLVNTFYKRGISFKKSTDLEKFIAILHKKYMSETESKGRLITKEELNRRKKQRFNAYYTDLFYLGDLANYKRPEHLSYYKYLKMSRDEGLGGDMNCDKGFLSKYSDIRY